MYYFFCLHFFSFYVLLHKLFDSSLSIRGYGWNESDAADGTWLRKIWMIMNTAVYLSVSLCDWLSVCLLSDCLSVYLSVRLSVCLLSVCLSVCFSDTSSFLPRFFKRLKSALKLKRVGPVLEGSLSALLPMAEILPRMGEQVCLSDRTHFCLRMSSSFLSLSMSLYLS